MCTICELSQYSVVDGRPVFEATDTTEITIEEMLSLSEEEWITQFMRRMGVEEILDEERLDELTLKDFRAEIENNKVAGARVSKLPHRDWRPLIKHIKFVGRRKNVFRFHVPNRFNGFEVYVEFVQFYDMVEDTSLSAPEAARLLLWAGDLKWHCGCPSFVFHGYAFILTSLDSAIVEENRFPKKMNKDLRGILCKHGRAVSEFLPFHLGDIARAIVQERRARGVKPVPKT